MRALQVERRNSQIQKQGLTGGNADRGESTIRTPVEWRLVENSSDGHRMTNKIQEEGSSNVLEIASCTANCACM